jgi:HAE1 family hydrophobic/amphiphilic exporter-1
MILIRQSIRFPVSTAVGVLLVSLFGIIALFRLPVQLTPDVERPRVIVETIWPGASPHEVEREIIDEQEEQLKSLEGLVEMESESQDSVGTVVLTFQVGTSIDSALLKVSNRLEQVPSYPADAERPVIRNTSRFDNAMAWFVVLPTKNDGFSGDISTLYDFADDFIKPEMERVPGVSSAAIFGGRKHEVQVTFDPAKLAARRVPLSELAGAIERENRNYSGGDFDEGKRRYVVRTVGDYRSPQDIENIVVAERNGVPIYLRDVARAELGFEKPRARVYEFGRIVLAMNAVKQTGANMLDAMTGLQDTVERLNRELLAPRGLRLVQVWDATDYIRDAIALVNDNIYIGGALAIGMLLLFLRALSPTFVIAASIPVSVVGTFLMMWWFGRTVNVISLAGLAFAVGTIVDNSIVVLENIYRHRQMGKSQVDAAHDGTVEVWGALVANTLTTCAVFIPVLFIKEEVGQLFGDIALAIACANALSLVVCLTVIPCLAARVLHAVEHRDDRRGFHDLWGIVPAADRLTRKAGDFVYWITGSMTHRIVTILPLAVLPLFLTWAMFPPREYLPRGNQNFLFGVLLPPAGYSLEETGSLNKIYDERLSSLWQAPAGSPEALQQPGGGVRDFFYVALNNLAFMGVSANDSERVRELEGPFMGANFEIPGAIAFIQQASIFQGDLGDSGLEVKITGPDLERLIALGGQVFAGIRQHLPGAQARPVPSLDLDNPEVHVTIDRRRAADLGISNRELGFTVSALVDGVKVSDYLHEGHEIDIRLQAEEGFAHRTHLLDQMPIAAPDGRLVTIGAVAEVTSTGGPVQINHSERQRTVTIQVDPARSGMQLETAMQAVDEKVLAPMRASGDLGGLYLARLSGSADKLVQTGRALRWNFILAVAITYLLMAALFESFVYPFVILFSVPLAGIGGILGLRAVNLITPPGSPQTLDVLTMLGFIILIGTVVNNAILVVHQSLIHMKEDGMPPRQAIREATGTRIRPIFISVATSIIGMLPLALFPGAGSELYRGLGAVVIGGLAVSTVFTLFVVPAIFSLSLDLKERIVARLRPLTRRVLGEAAAGAAAPGPAAFPPTD